MQIQDTLSYVELLAFKASMVRTVLAQFPKRCTACPRIFKDPAQYFQQTRALGAPRFDPIDDDERPLGVMAFANCACGSTLGLLYEDTTRHAAFNHAVREAAARRDGNIESVLEELVLAVQQEARVTQMPDAAATAPDALVQELGGAIMGMVSKSTLSIPAYSAVAQKVQGIMKRPNYGLADLAKLIELDQAITVAVLRLANMSIYRRGGNEVTSLTLAINKVGAEEVERIAMASTLGLEANQTGALASVRRHLWHQSLSTAVVSRYLGKARGLGQESAFVCGLLHDIGSLVTAMSLDAHLAKHKELPTRPVSWWLRLIESFHVEVGAMAAERWALPPLVQDVIKYHHAPNRQAQNQAMIDVVIASDAVAYLASQSSHVTARDLQALPVLRGEAECHLLAESLPECPEIIASLEPSAGGATQRALARDARAVAGKLMPRETPFVNHARPDEEYMPVELSPQSIRVRGKVPLAESFLCRMRITNEDHDIIFWAKTERCVAGDKGEHMLTLSPFALDSTTQRQWQGFVTAFNTPPAEESDPLAAAS
jgi:HD-like signal output (HDOD) protein